MPLKIEEKNGVVNFAFSADSMFSIGDVSRYTSYDPQTLRRLERDGKIPESRRDESGRRYWTAGDIVKIRQHRNARGRRPL